MRQREQHGAAHDRPGLGFSGRVPIGSAAPRKQEFLAKTGLDRQPNERRRLRPRPESRRMHAVPWISFSAGDTTLSSARIIAPSTSSGGQNPGRPAPELKSGAILAPSAASSRAGAATCISSLTAITSNSCSRPGGRCRAGRAHSPDREMPPHRKLRNRGSPTVPTPAWATVIFRRRSFPGQRQAQQRQSDAKYHERNSRQRPVGALGGKVGGRRRPQGMR